MSSFRFCRSVSPFLRAHGSFEALWEGGRWKGVGGRGSGVSALLRESSVDEL